MFKWLFKKKNVQENSLIKNVDEHPDTRLVKVLQLPDAVNVQVLELQGSYYLLEKQKSQKQDIYQVEDRQLLAAIRKKKVSTQQVADYLGRMTENSALSGSVPVQTEKESPPVSPKSSFDFTIDDQLSLPAPPKKQKEPPATLVPPQSLVSRLTEAMSEFAENNPDMAEYLDLDNKKLKSPGNDKNQFQEMDFQDYMQALVPVKKEPPPMLTPASFSPHSRMPTRQPVTASLDGVIQKQRDRLREVQQRQKQVEFEKNRVHMILNRKKYIDAKIIEIEQMLSKLSDDANRLIFTEGDLIQKTTSELEMMEKELNQILTDGHVLKHLLENEHVYSDFVSGPQHPIEAIVRSLQMVTRQRRMLNEFNHYQENLQLEQERVNILLKRKQEVELSIRELKQIIYQIEEANQNILSLDSLAVTEPVPATARYELKRLEYELQTILGDPGIQHYIQHYPSNLDFRFGAQ